MVQKKKKKIFLILSILLVPLAQKNWEENYNQKSINIKKKFTSINSYRYIGFEYIEIAMAIRDFAILSKLLPWDHLPGILLVKESGGQAKHFDGLPYNCRKEKNNLVVTNSINLLN